MTITCDGWTDAIGRAVIVVIASGGDTPIILDIVHGSLERKTGHWIAALLFKSIDAVGPKNVVQVCMDNASSNRRAAEDVTAKHPHIVTTNCAAHCLNLMLKDICEMEVFTPVSVSVHLNDCVALFLFVCLVVMPCCFCYAWLLCLVVSVMSGCYASVSDPLNGCAAFLFYFILVYVSGVEGSEHHSGLHSSANQSSACLHSKVQLFGGTQTWRYPLRHASDHAASIFANP